VKKEDKALLTPAKTSSSASKIQTKTDIDISATSPNSADPRGNKNSNPSSIDFTKSVPAHWSLLFGEDAIDKALTRMAFEILERDNDFKRLAIVGIKTHGETLAQRIYKKIVDIEKRQPRFGVIDITLYRDDIGTSNPYPVLKGSELDFEVSGSRIVLIDDVLFTGRTIRGALDAIIDYGRPKRVELATLIDRGHRELPIRPDYIGKNVPTKYKDKIVVRLKEYCVRDAVYLAPDDK
jgi:pyrimidine operon attenuation protein / uracil phosphoribosyltransferase